MPVDVRPVTARRHPSHDVESVEGPSSLLADDANELPVDADELELPADFEMQPERVEEVRWDDDVEPLLGGPEVDDTPGDDALIAAARIARFDDAHEGTQPVDIGPWRERDGTTDDASPEEIVERDLRNPPMADDS